MELKTLRQKVKGLTDGGEDRGVSPVIGVILMVAITVILAAVIGAFVLGLGDDLSGSTAPQASFDMSANSDWDQGTSTGELFYINHRTGDNVEIGDIRVIIRNDSGATVAALDASSPAYTNGTNVELLLNGQSFGTTEGEFSESDEFGTGDSITITDTGDLTGDTDYTIQIVHQPSGSTMSESTLRTPSTA